MNKPVVSFEFFPPQTPEGVEKLAVTRKKLAALHPDFFSVTFGAGGSTQERSLDVVRQTKAEGFRVAPHLSCVGSTRENIRDVLQTYQQLGIGHIVALSDFLHLRLLLTLHK